MVGTISNNVPGTYAAALDAQVLGRFGKMVPRWLWVCVMVLIYFVLAAAGREHLLVIFQVSHLSCLLLVRRGISSRLIVVAGGFEVLLHLNLP